MRGWKTTPTPHPGKSNNYCKLYRFRMINNQSYYRYS